MKIKTNKIDGKIKHNAYNVVNIYLNEEKDESKTLADLASSGITGFATNQTWNAFKASNTFSRDDYIAKLTEYGVSPQKAPEAADHIVDAMRQGWAKPFLVAVSATGGAYAILEALSAIPGIAISRWSRLKKLLVSLVIGGIVTVVYVLLRNAGYLS